MSDPIDPAKRAHLEAVCDKLLAAGWITGFLFHDTRGLYGIKWTAKGLERARWVNLIADEMNLGPQGVTALMVICHMQAPHD